MEEAYFHFDEMETLFLQYLAIYCIAQWPKNSQRGSIFGQTLNKPSKNYQRRQKLAKVAKFRQIWSHCSYFLLCLLFDNKISFSRFQESGESISRLTPESKGKEILVPLTGSMYVPGVLSDPDHLVSFPSLLLFPVDSHKTFLRGTSGLYVTIEG